MSIMEDFSSKKTEQLERRMRQSRLEVRLDSIQQVRDLAARQERQQLADLLDPQTVPTATRRAAAKALSEIAQPAQVPLFINALQTDPDRGVRLSATRALGRLADDAAIPALIVAFGDKEATVRQEAATALSSYNSPSAFDALKAALLSSGERQRFVRQYAAEALGKLGDRRAVPFLIEALRDESELVRPAVATALGQLGQTVAIEPLQRAHHITAHARGFDCAECKAIDAALATLTSKLKDTL